MKFLLPTLVAASTCVLCVLAVTPATTKWPEICRVMRKSRDCDDSTFRIACPHFCNISCSTGFQYLGSKGLCYAMTKTSQTVWGYATDYCRAYYSRLAKIEDAADANVLNYLVGSVGTSEIRYSIGAFNMATSKLWNWVDFSNFTGTFWSPGNPTVLDGSSNCAASYKNEAYKQESNKCDENMGFVCEMTPIVIEKYDSNGEPI